MVLTESNSTEHASPIYHTSLNTSPRFTRGMLRLVLLPVLAALILTAFLGIAPASAVAAPNYTVELFDENGNLLGTLDSPPVEPIPGGVELTANFTSDDTSITFVTFNWLYPNGGGIGHSKPPVFVNGVTTVTDHFLPTHVGSWTLRVSACNTIECSNTDTIFSAEIPFTVQSGFVIPESPLGSILLIVVSVGTVAAVMAVKHRRSLT